MDWDSSVFIHPNATVIGMVSMGPECSIWPGAVLRGDTGRISLGKAVNIQDNTTIHTDSQHNVSLGDYTLVGHNVMLHGCQIGNCCMIGIGSIVLDGAEIGDGSQIMAGCMIRGETKIPPKSLVLSKNGDIKIFPGKAKPVWTVAGCLEYAELAKRHQKEQWGPFTKEEEAELKKKAQEILGHYNL